MALFSGEDGLDLIRGLERTAHRLLRPGGVVVVEHADTQGGQVPWIFAEERGWADAADHPDLNNRPASRRPARHCREHRTDFDPAVRVRGGPLDGTAIRHQ